MGLLNVLQDLFESVQISLAVAEELAQGRRRGIHLPEIKRLLWLDVEKVSGNARISQIATPEKVKKKFSHWGWRHS